jgi:O-acetylserine/cysteine efflux transporter
MQAPPKFRPADLAAVLAIVFIWGINFVVMKIGLRDFTPFQMGAGRYLFAVLPLVLFIKPPKLHWKWVLLYGLFQGVGQFGFLFLALQAGMTAALASVLMQTQVFFTALLGFVLLRERTSLALQMGLLLAALGLGCFAMNYLAPQVAAAAPTSTALGFALSLCGAASWAASNIVARKAQQASGGFDPLAFVVWASLVPVLPFVLLSLAFDPPAARWHWAAAPLASWLAVAFLGLVATVGAYGMWTALLKRYPANRVAPFSLGVPVVGITAGMLLLGEAVTAWQWAGIALVVAALGCVMFGAGLIRKIGLQPAPAGRK